MKKSNLKYYIGIILILIIDSLHSIFFSNNEKYDIYLFYDYPNSGRYLTNILWDISNLFSFSLITYWLSFYNKIVFKPLFLISIYIWISYLLFYNQTSSLLIIPIYIFLALYYNKNKLK